MSSSSSSSDYFDEEEQKDKIHDNVSLNPQIVPMRRASRIVSFQQSKCNSHFEVDVNSLRLKSNIVNQSSLSEELERVWNMANMFRIQNKSKEISAQFSKLSSSQNHYNAINVEVSKVSSMFTPICGWSSILIVDDQIINR